MKKLSKQKSLIIGFGSIFLGGGGGGEGVGVVYVCVQFWRSKSGFSYRVWYGYTVVKIWHCWAHPATLYHTDDNLIAVAMLKIFLFLMSAFKLLWFLLLLDSSLRAKVWFDREEKKQYRIPVSIRDSGSPPKTGVHYVNVIIGDVNDVEMKEGSSTVFAYTLQVTFYLIEGP